MPGSVLHVGATVTCAHGGQAQPMTPFPRVQVSGMPVVTQTSPYLVAGCAFVPPAGNGPCVTAQWMLGATRVFAGGAPLLLDAGISVCVPTGTPLLPLTVQKRVLAT
jgi:hypothetical protein